MIETIFIMVIVYYTLCKIEKMTVKEKEDTGFSIKLGLCALAMICFWLMIAILVIGFIGLALG